MRRALVCGGGGFIGAHLVKELKRDGFWVRAIDLKPPEFSETHADDFVLGDLCERSVCEETIDQPFDQIFQLAADMGGASYICSGENDADILHNSAQINLNVLKAAALSKSKKILFPSSACVYPQHNQRSTDNPDCREQSVYPADPESEYGWEKLFSERLYLAYARDKRIDVRIARFHNIFGPEGAWRGGREKAPAAICRKVAQAKDGSSIEIWGDGEQTRSFLYIEECLEGIRRLVQSDFSQPLNIGAEEMISINGLAEMIIALSGKTLSIRNVDGPLGVRGRRSENTLIRSQLNWAPKERLLEGMQKTYAWIAEQVAKEAP